MKFFSMSERKNQHAQAQSYLHTLILSVFQLNAALYLVFL